MIRIGIIVGSTRPNRRAAMVAEWVERVAEARLRERGSLLEEAVAFEQVDLVDFDLPLLDEPTPAAIGGYRRPHTQRWAAKIDSLDGFLFVLPEYNHGVPAALKNAIDFLFTEWNDKAAGFVSYGLQGGVRAVEQLRLVLSEVKVASVRSQVALGLFTDFEISDIGEPGRVIPADFQEPIVHRLLEELEGWAVALKQLRQHFDNDVSESQA